MNKRRRKQSFFSSVWVAVACSALLFAAIPVSAIPLKIAVISDTHLSKDNDGTVLKAVLAKIGALNASSDLDVKFIVANGDMVFNRPGPTQLTPDQYKAELERFFGIMETGLKGADIKLLVIRGNHDENFVNEASDAEHAPYIAMYKEVLSKYSHLLVGYTGDNLGYHFVSDDVSLVMLDYESESAANTKDKVNDIEWLRGIKNDLKSHVLVFGHHPAFSGTQLAYSMGKTDAFLDFMAENGMRYYIASHDHVFTHALLEKKDPAGNTVYTINQIITPSAAMETDAFMRAWPGKFFAKTPGNWVARLYDPAGNINKSLGFIIVTVTEDALEVTAYKKADFISSYDMVLK